jgi:[calcium/calmodulin-dependent protein kinase] kinase
VKKYDTDGNKLLNEYAIVGLLGQGAFGKVKLAIDTTTDKPVAIKILSKQRLEKESRIHNRERKTPMQLVQQEIEIMKTRKHPNLVKLHNVINDESVAKLYMVLEYMSGGTLAKTPSLTTPTEPPATLDVMLIRRQLKGILHGLQFLHTRGVIHMDIKPENVLLDEHGHCKLADFGVSSLIEENFKTDEDVLQTKQGTPIFFAPEMIGQSDFHGMATDVWALGVTMYIVVFESLPFRGNTIYEYHQNVAKDEPIFPDEFNVIPFELYDVLSRMLIKEAQLRITVDQLLGHPFLVPTEKVPLAWWIRLWKESKLQSCASEEEREAIAKHFKIKDNTDRKSNRIVPTEIICKSPLYLASPGKRSDYGNSFNSAQS